MASCMDKETQHKDEGPQGSPSTTWGEAHCHGMAPLWAGLPGALPFLPLVVLAQGRPPGGSQPLSIPQSFLPGP